MTESFLSTRNPFLTETRNKPSAEQGQPETPVGEVVETSLTGYTAHTYKLDEPPPFGGLVRVRDRAGATEIFGAVYHIATGGMDPGRRAATRGSGLATQNDEQIYIDNPQLSRLLKTEFGVLVLGCSHNTNGRRKSFSYVFPDYPPPLHYGVTLCSDETLVEFTEDKSYLRTILEAQQVPGEELIAAILRRATRAREAAGQMFLVESLRYLARSLKQDYDRFKIIVEKCEVAQ